MQNLVGKVDVGLLVDWTPNLHHSRFRAGCFAERICLGYYRVIQSFRSSYVVDLEAGTNLNLLGLRLGAKYLPQVRRKTRSPIN
jgi:hypothetical protein